MSDPAGPTHRYPEPAQPHRYPEPAQPHRYPEPARPHPEAAYSFRPPPLPRPGGVRAASILAWIEGALLFLSAPLLAFASFVSGSIASDGGDPTPESWLLIAAALNLLGGAALLAAGSFVAGGRAVGRIVYAGAVVVLLGASAAWISQGSATTWIAAAMFLVMPVIGLVLLTRPPVTAWFRSHRRPAAGT